MRSGVCARCGAEDSMFWYPYAFGVAPIPSVTDLRTVDRSQYFMLCDDCQMKFTEFMRNKSYPFFNAEKLKKMMDENETVIVQDIKEAEK